VAGGQTGTVHEEQGYRERASSLPGAVVWTNGTGVGQRRVLPDGCMDLIWSDGELFVAGPDTRAYELTDGPGRRYTGLRFAPGTAPAILGLPAYELRDVRVPLADIWPAAQVRRISEQIAATHAGPVLEAVARRRLAEVPTPTWSTAVVVGAVRRGTAVPVIARATGLSERQLRRRCLEAFGYGPKTLGRILRMNRALDLARAGRPLAEVAAETGYADQAHLTREVKALAGVPPAVLLGPAGVPSATLLEQAGEPGVGLAS
jgi:AraC-like DNA-binding protein